jgi:hypothetical protein
MMMRMTRRMPPPIYMASTIPPPGPPETRRLPTVPSGVTVVGVLPDLPANVASALRQAERHAQQIQDGTGDPVKVAAALIEVSQWVERLAAENQDLTVLLAEGNDRIAALEGAIEDQRRELSARRVDNARLDSQVRRARDDAHDLFMYPDSPRARVRHVDLIREAFPDADPFRPL